MGIALALLAGCDRPLVSVRVVTFRISERLSRSARTVATVLSSVLASFAVALLDRLGSAFSSLAIARASLRA